MGQAEAVRGRQRQSCLQHFPRIREGRGRRPAGGPGTGGNGKADIPALPAGKDTWHQSSVKSILTNEKYKGDALLQKQYTADFLTKKRKKNQGEIPQYYLHRFAGRFYYERLDERIRSARSVVDAKLENTSLSANAS